MEFILDNKKYSILNHELLIDYLIVDQYFRCNYSKYDYDIKFEFITPLLKKDKIEFEDILDQTGVLEELIEKQEINFVDSNFKIRQDSKNSFQISYQDIVFRDINVGEAVPVLILLTSLLNTTPIITLNQIKEEVEFFIEKFRSYSENNFKDQEV